MTLHENVIRADFKAIGLIDACFLLVGKDITRGRRFLGIGGRAVYAALPRMSGLPFPRRAGGSDIFFIGIELIHHFLAVAVARCAREAKVLAQRGGARGGRGFCRA